MDVETYLKENSKLIQEHLHKVVLEQGLPHDNLYRAARYSLLAGGKRLRPILAIATAESFGCDITKVLNAACSLELVHTYSLIHDDLPCMDNDDLRRGKPTLHNVYSEAHAILTGDYLLTYAFEMITTDPTLEDTQKVKLLKVLSQCAGGNGMIGGQIIDIEAEGKQIGIEELQIMHKKKTGALVTASTLFGGIVANIDEKKLETLQAFSEDLGLAFQIIDDVLDVTQTEEVLGKTAKSDLSNHKTTYVSLMGLNEAKEKASSLLRSAQEKLSTIPLNNNLLSELSNFFINREF